MKSCSGKLIAACLLVASAGSLAFPSTAGTSSIDRQQTHGVPAGNDPAAAIERSGKEQLAKANTAYARGDHVEAFRLYRNIAVLGIPEAHYRLGLMYIAGLGTRKNIRQAEYWLKLAAAGNHPGAAKALASMEIERHG